MYILIKLISQTGTNTCLKTLLYGHQKSCHVRRKPAAFLRQLKYFLIIYWLSKAIKIRFCTFESIWIIYMSPESHLMAIIFYFYLFIFFFCVKFAILVNNHNIKWDRVYTICAKNGLPFEGIQNAVSLGSYNKHWYNIWRCNLGFSEWPVHIWHCHLQ